MNEWGFGFSLFLISTPSMLTLFHNNKTTNELVMDTKVLRSKLEHSWCKFQHLPKSKNYNYSCQRDYSSCFIFLYRLFNMGSSARNFMGETSKHILSTEIFPDFMHLYSRGDKKNKNSKPFTKINSTESFTENLVLKFLPETIRELNILQKIFQDLTHYDKLVIQLT